MYWYLNPMNMFIFIKNADISITKTFFISYFHEKNA